MRYNSSPYLTALLDPLTGRFNQTYARAPERTVVGLNLGYTRKLTKKVEFDVRLSVSNLLDEFDHEPIAADAITGIITAVRPVTPRNWALSAAFRF